MSVYQYNELLAHCLSLSTCSSIPKMHVWAKHIQFWRYFGGNLTLGRETTSTGMFLDPKNMHILVIMFIMTIRPVGILLALTQYADADRDTQCHNLAV